MCENTFERVCNPKREKKCETVYENKCKTLQKRSCSTAYKNVPYEETECNDEYVKECPKKWEKKDGAKVWIPETNKCVNLVSIKWIASVAICYIHNYILWNDLGI